VLELFYLIIISLRVWKRL